MTEIVKANVNREINVELLREESNPESKDIVSYQNKPYSIVKIVITPKIWKGSGVLGYYFFFLNYNFIYPGADLKIFLNIFEEIQTNLNLSFLGFFLGKQLN